MAHGGVGREVLSAFVGPADPLWVRFLDSIPHDFYHLPSYANLASKYEGGEPVAFYAEVHQNGLLLPLLIRPIPEHFGFSKGCTDAASPYGYPGPLIRMHDSDTVALLLRAFRRYAFENNVVSALIRLHPVLNDTPERLTELGDIVRHGAPFTLVNGIAQKHLAATNDKHLRLAPSKLMTYSQVIWLKSASARVFHLGGGVGSRTDSLFDFKAGFSKLRSSFWTCSTIIDEGKYTRLVKASSKRLEQREGFFFPTYR